MSAVVTQGRLILPLKWTICVKVRVMQTNSAPIDPSQRVESIGVRTFTLFLTVWRTIQKCAFLASSSCTCKIQFGSIATILTSIDSAWWDKKNWCINLAAIPAGLVRNRRKRFKSGPNEAIFQYNIYWRRFWYQPIWPTIAGKIGTKVEQGGFCSMRFLILFGINRFVFASAFSNCQKLFVILGSLLS